MKKSLVFGMMLVALALGSAAQAEETGNPQEATPVAAKKICRTEQVTGSRTRRNRICLTQAEWDKVAADTQKNVSEYQNKSSMTPQTSSSPFGG